MPSVNTVLFMDISSEEKGEIAGVFKSRIADFTDDYYLIELPIHRLTKRIKRFSIGEKIEAYYTTADGVNCFFQTKVIGHGEEAIKLIKITKPDPESITRVQRRNFLRVPAQLELSIHIKDEQHVVTLTEDVSGGGLAFKYNGTEKLEETQLIRGWLLLPPRQRQVEAIPFGAEIVRIKSLETGLQLIMLQFNDISENERQKIVRYCFERQLEMRKN